MYKFCVFFLFCFNFILAQSKPQDDLNKFYEIADSICLVSKDPFFCKALKFYREHKFDSSYVYSNKVSLNKISGKTYQNVLNYIQGVSASNKKLYKKALNSFLSISDDRYFLSLKKSKLGRVYLSLKQFDKAIIYYSEWEKLSSNTDLKSKKNAYHNFALCYIHTRKYNKAKEYFNKGLALIELNDTLTLIKAKMNLANIYYNQYLDDDAIPLFEEAYNLAKSCSDVDLKQYTAQNMAVVERNRKRYKESVTYYREFIKWKDSIWNRDRIWELTEKDKQFAVAQKQQEIIIQEEKLKRQRVVQKGLLFGASGLLVFIGLLGFFYKKLQKKNALITQQKEDLAIANKTKNYLFSVVSHDLRSPMNTIKHQHQQLKKHIANHNIKGIEEANNTAITVTESTSHLLNNVLHWSLEQSNQMVFSQKEYPLQPIIKHVLHGYENLVEANDVSITTNFHENALVSVDRESIKIVLRNILDNAVKYMNGKGKITIASGIDSENYAYISIQDTGIGITEERLEKINALKGVSIDKINRSEGVGLGLILCQTLVKKNQGILSFESVVNEGTNVIIQLPISNQ
ncbi:conserved hypothetical protein [Tenacibaculum amylolyticum]